MQLSAINSFEQLANYLRTFVNWSGDAAPYDSGGIASLLGALLDNIRTQAIESDFEEMKERLTAEQIATLQRIAVRVRT